MRESPRPDADKRAQVAVVMRAPWMVWRLHAHGAGFQLEPSLDLQPWWQPPGAVDLTEVGAVDGPAADGGALICRGVPHHGVWTPISGLTLRHHPEDLHAFWRALCRTLLPANPALRREDILRHGGHALVRFAHLSAFAAQR